MGTDSPPVARTTRAAWMSPTRGLQREAAGRRLNRRDAGAELHAHAALARECDEAVANVLGAVRPRKQLARLRFERQGNAEIVLEERALLVQRPRSQHAAHQVGRRIGDETLGSQHRRQHVAAPAAADQDLAAAIGRAFDQRDVGAVRRSKRRCDEPSRAAADDRHRHRCQIRAADDTDYADLRRSRSRQAMSSRSSGSAPVKQFPPVIIGTGCRWRRG